MDSDDINKRAQEGWEQIKSGADEAKSAFQEGADAALDKGDEVLSDLKDFISEKPLTALGIAAVAGLLIGSLFIR